MSKIDIFKLDEHDAAYLDMLLSACAEAAVKELRKKYYVKDRKTKQAKKTVEDGEVDLYYSCYLESGFCLTGEKEHLLHVHYRLGRELDRLHPVYNIPCYELQRPILAYALIVSNEYNKRTVQKRIQQEAKHGDPKDPNVWKHVDPFSINYTMDKRALGTFNNQKEKIEEIITGTTIAEVEYKGSIFVTEAFTSVFDAYALMSNYELVMMLQDSSIMALFLRDVIKKSHNESQPIDTLLRLYLANRLDNILFRVRGAVDCTRITMPKKCVQSKILQYFTKDQDQFTIEDLMMHDIEALRSREMRERLSPEFRHNFEKFDQMEFDELYDRLSQTIEVPEEGLFDLIAFYLDKDFLHKTKNLMEQALEFARLVVKDLNSSAETTVKMPEAYLQNIINNSGISAFNEEIFKSLRDKPDENGEDNEDDENDVDNE